MDIRYILLLFLYNFKQMVKKKTMEQFIFFQVIARIQRDIKIGQLKTANKNKQAKCDKALKLINKERELACKIK